MIGSQEKPLMNKKPHGNVKVVAAGTSFKPTVEARRTRIEKDSKSTKRGKNMITSNSAGPVARGGNGESIPRKHRVGLLSRVRRVFRRKEESVSVPNGDSSPCWCSDIPSREAAAAFRALSNKKFDENDFEGALKALNQELVIARLTAGGGGGDDAEVGRVLNHMGVQMTHMGPEYEFFALSALAEALSNLQDTVGPGDEEASIVAHNLWVLLHNVRVRQEGITKQDAVITIRPKRNSVAAKSA